MLVTTGSWGNSLGLRIPRNVAEKLGLSEGMKLDLDVLEDGSIVLVKNSKMHYLKRLVSKGLEHHQAEKLLGAIESSTPALFIFSGANSKNVQQIVNLLLEAVPQSQIVNTFVVAYDGKVDVSAISYTDVGMQMVGDGENIESIMRDAVRRDSDMIYLGLIELPTVADRVNSLVLSGSKVALMIESSSANDSLENVSKLIQFSEFDHAPVIYALHVSDIGDEEVGHVCDLQSLPSGNATLD